MRGILYRDSVGEWRWTARADNGEILSDSAEGYIRRRDAEHGFHLLFGQSIPLDLEESDGAG